MRKILVRLQSLVFLGALGASCAANSGDDADSGSGAGGADGSGVNGSGGEGGGLFLDGEGGMGGASSCADFEAAATVVNRPVDIIFVIDNSGSMSGEIKEVEEEISANFASIIEAADPPIDYRVILVAEFGNWGGQNICIVEPLGGKTDGDGDFHCDDTSGPPINTARFFHHSSSISSHNALCRLFEDFDTADDYGLQPGGYQDVLRVEAFKTFVVITDDSASCAVNNNQQYNDGNDSDGNGVDVDWDADMLALSPTHFGTAAERNYAFHSIVAMSPYDGGDLTLPHPPGAPIVTSECSPGAEHPGTGYQALSKLTGGLRFPTCGLDYTPIFQEIAEGVIEGAQVGCEFELPEPPDGEELDPDTATVIYTPGGGGSVVVLEQAASAGDCGSDKFYIEGDKVFLCPDSCALVQGDPDAEISLKFDCKSGSAN